MRAANLLLLAALLSLCSAVSFFPCHPSKAKPNKNVSCGRVVMPPGLCGRCPLRPTNKNGSFQDCTRIYDTDGDDCRAALQEYVDENGRCDPVRAAAIPKLIEGDNDARSVVDYFLYSVCEQCCDCIPMGAQKRDYDDLAAAHSDAASALWKEERGNCPAHAQFDVCKVLPNVRYFAKPGDPDKIAPKICSKLREWQGSSEADGWPSNPQTSIVPEIEEFLRGMLVATDCASKDIWGRCYDMEDKQSNLDIPDDFVEPEEETVITRPPTTTETSTTSTTTTTTTDSSTTPTTTETDEIDSNDTATTPASTDDEQVTNDTDDPIDSDSGADSDADDDSGDGSQETSGDGSSEDDDSGNGSQVDADSDSSADADSDGGDSSDSDSDSAGDDGDQSTPSSGDPSNEEGTSSNVEGIGSCFPSTSKVELQSGATIPISQLRIGDSVRVSVDTFSEVFLFSHRTSSSAPSYIEITTTATNHTLTLTPGHYLYVNHQLGPAHTVEVGHQILTAHQGWATVSAVRRTDASGLYNPHTVQGDIVVDGFVASTYTTAVPTHIATSLLAPLRALYRRGFVSERLFGSFLAEGFRDGILRTVQ